VVEYNKSVVFWRYLCIFIVISNTSGCLALSYNFFVREFSAFTGVRLTSSCLGDMVLCDWMIGARHFENIQRWSDPWRWDHCAVFKTSGTNLPSNVVPDRRRTANWIWRFSCLWLLKILGVSQDIVFGIATRCRLDGQGSNPVGARFSTPIQINPDAHLYNAYQVSFPLGGKVAEVLS